MTSRNHRRLERAAFGALVLALLALLTASSPPFGDSPPPPTPPASEASAPPPYPGVYAFVDVRIVPMDSRRILQGQTVIVGDGIIREIGPADSVAIPPGATVIDGGGRYLMPGLGDMYVRLPESDLADEELEDLLFLFVANGVTTVRQGSGREEDRSLQSRLRNEQLLGPTLYTTSPPSLRYAPWFDADSMEAAVMAVARQQWDLLQVPETLSLRGWNLLTTEMEEFIVNAGGPVPDSVGLHRALTGGTAVVDRLDGLVEAAAADPYQDRIRWWFAPSDTSESARRYREAVRPASDSVFAPKIPPPPLDSLAATLDLRKARGVAGKARASGVWMVPTLSGWEVRQSPLGVDQLLRRPGVQYVPREVRGGWIREKEATPRVDSLTADRLTRVRMATTKHLSDVGGGLVLGTDSPALFNVGGFAVHREMELMREAGITPYEVLVAATRDVARFASSQLGQPGNFGTVATGNRADLVLVACNPLQDLETLRRPAGVMLKGLWLPAAEIAARLEGMALRNGGGSDPGPLSSVGPGEDPAASECAEASGDAETAGPPGSPGASGAPDADGAPLPSGDPGGADPAGGAGGPPERSAPDAPRGATRTLPSPW